MNQEGPTASVLVVEDTIENLRLLSELLGRQGYEVRAVTNGRQAIQAVEREPPDLILLDVNMPEMNGYDVCRYLTAQERSKDVPVIFITALTETVDKVRAFDAGGVDYVTKPFQIDEVLARVKTHIALRRAQADVADSYTRLRTAEQLRDDLVHMVVHDLRSPLGALLINLRLLESVAPLVDHDREILQAAVESAEAIERMTTTMLDVSRLEAAKLPVDTAVWNLAQMARDVRAALSASEIAPHPIDIDSADVVNVTCDGALVRRVMENLVSNGLKHSPTGARLRISIGSGQGRARFSVHDQGCGVRPDVREQIFQKFGAVTARQTSSYHSVGLGLAFCKLAIEAHGGTVGVDAGEPAGSTFWFELPA